MGINYCSKTRRQFILGTGKSLLLLPVLPSLLPREVYARASMAPKRLMTFMMNHNWRFDHLNSQLESGLVNSANSAIVREKSLRTLGLTGRSYSQYLMDPVFDSLAQKDLITFARGYNSQRIGGNGHCSTHLGGATSTEYGTQGGSNFQSTIDYVIESSATLRPLSNSQVRIARIKYDSSYFCFIKRDPGGSEATAPRAYDANETKDLYRDLFSNLTAGTVPVVDLTNTRKSNILNRVFPAFQSYKNNRRISAEDKARLDQHMAVISDLQRKHTLKPTDTVVNTPIMCSERPALPGTSVDAYLDMLAIGFKCGLVQFGGISFDWQPNHDGYHSSGSNAGLVSGHQNFGYSKAARLIKALDTLEGNTGKTYIENMLVGMFTQNGQGGADGHSNNDKLVTFFGSMGGKLKSGKYYRFNGMPHNPLFMTILNLMGVPASEYSRFSSVSGQGYGHYESTNTSLGQRLFQPLSEMLNG